MSDEHRKQMIGVRAHLLAKVFLTQRMAIVTEIHEIAGIDCIVHFVPSENFPKLPFPAMGVVIRGTSRPLEDESMANKLLASGWGDVRANRFVMPFIGLVYSMAGDVGYWTWGYKPILHKGTDIPGLRILERPECKRIEQNTYKQMTSTVFEWYEVMNGIVFNDH